ncbi:MAG: EVE domain-containing protein [Cytophagales bacterium]|nr:EVE domain-containing protein [Rhizobacter sp.]
MDDVSNERNNWVAVACAEHVARGREMGIMQVGHGKGPPLKRIHAGDRVAYYSPVQRLGEKEPCQAFTAIGVVRDDRVYQADMGNGFVPFRKDVDYARGTHEAPIRPLLDTLSFTRDNPKNWGYAFRFGLIKVSDEDMDTIAQAMGAKLLEHAAR